MEKQPKKKRRTVSEVVGYRMREARNRLDWPQSFMGIALGKVLGKPWARQQVHAAESGERAFTAEELMAIANVLNVPLYSLFLPPEDTAAVKVGPRSAVPAAKVAKTVLGSYAEARAPVVSLFQDQVFAALGRADQALGEAKMAVIDAFAGQGEE